MKGFQRFISNKDLYQLHAWLGLHLGLLLFVICFSGTFAVFSNEVDWLANEALRHEGNASGEPQWQAMKESIESRFPRGTLLGLYKETYTGNGPYFATAAYVKKPNGQTIKVYLNPQTGALKGYTSFFNAQRFFRSFHRRFFDGARGIILVTLCSLPFLLSILSGFLFYKKWLQNLFKLRWRGSIRLLWADLHRLAGFWSLLFALITALTGVFYFAELILQRTSARTVLQEPAPQNIGETRLAGYPEVVQFLPLSTYVDSARAAYPQLDVKTLRLPQHVGGFIYIDGQASNPLTRNRSDYVLLDPLDASVVHVQRSADLGLIPLMSDLADPLHFGYFGGLTSKIVWFLFGLMVSFSVLSGTYLWALRTTARKSRARHPKSQNKGLLIALALSLLYFGWTGWATFRGIQSYGPAHGLRSKVIAEPGPAPWPLTLYLKTPQRGQDKLYLTLDHKLTGLANLKSVVLVGINRIDTFSNSGHQWRIPVDRAMEAQWRKAPKQTILLTSYTGEQKAWPISTHILQETSAHLKHPLKNPAEADVARWPKMASGIWWYIGVFILATVGIIMLWARWVLLALSKRAYPNGRRTL